MTHFTRELNRLLIAMLAAFMLIILVATYYAVVGRMTLLTRDDNPRLVEAEQSVMRGGLYDRDNRLLAQTYAGADDFAEREYVAPAAYSAVGYYSYRYGAGGAEAAYDDYLSGALLPPTAGQLMLGRPVTGQDVRLTLDAIVQQQAVDALGERAGAAVAMHVPSGEVLALASLPTFDPNNLDEEWNDLVNAPGTPFFNRVLQGRYQPGTMMQIPLLVDALTRGQSLGAQFPSGAAPVQLDDLTLRCAADDVPSLSLKLEEAFIYGCPSPFAQLAPVINAEQLEDSLALLRLNAPPTLPDFVPEPETPLAASAMNLTPTNLRENILGQGDVSLSPVALNALTAAIANGGNTPPPRMLSATRLPDSATWTNAPGAQTTLPYMTASTAATMRELYGAAAERGTAALDDWGLETVGGVSGIAYAGEGSQVWFTGYTFLTPQQSVVVTVVLEDTDDVEAAARAGRQILQAAAVQLEVEQAQAPTGTEEPPETD